jgi:hypothetical protein
VELVRRSLDRPVQQPDGFQPGPDQQHRRWRRFGSFARGIAVGVSVALNRLILCSELGAAPEGRPSFITEN